MTLRLGIDLGGTKTAAVVLSPSGAIEWEHRVATPRDSYTATIEMLSELVASGERATRSGCTVGIGTPGAISPATGLVKNANSTWLNGRPLKQDLETRIGREIRLANDANCLAVSEARDGAGAGASVVFGVILGTGVGGGLVIDGRSVTGANAIGGEWGHNPLPSPEDDERPGPDCYCGRRGCIETFLSGPGLAASFKSASGQSVTSETVVGLAESGDADARKSIERWTSRLARALATIINVVDPDVIVVGGGLSQLRNVYTDVPARWGALVFSDRVDTQLKPAKFGDASGVRGAAWLWDAVLLSR